MMSNDDVISPRSVEAVEVQLANGQVQQTPDLHQREMKINMEEVSQTREEEKIDLRKKI